MQRYSLDAYIGGDSHRLYRGVKKVISDASVIITTCVGAGQGHLKDVEFACVVIDEAAQVSFHTLPTTLTDGR